MDDFRLGVVESTLNKENPEDFPVAEIVTEILRLQFGKRPEADHGDCLIAKCEIHFQSQIAKILNETNTWKSKKRQGLEFEGSNCQATCLLEKEFKAFFDSVKVSSPHYFIDFDSHSNQSMQMLVKTRDPIH